MPTDWSDTIVLCDLPDEPELAEDIAALVDRLKTTPTKALPHVVLNFAGVGYLNSSHIAAMLRMRKRLQEAQRKLVIASMSDDVWSVMLLTGLDKVFEYAPNTATALTRLQLEGPGAGSAA
jgi:anti-anti-sigma factor